MNLRSCTVFGLCLAVAPSLLADFTYRETTTITGGSIVGMLKMASMFSKQARKVGEPTTSTVYLKGNQLARMNENDSQIIDLDRETITQISHKDHTYTVMTFEQMRQQIEAARLQAEKKRSEAPQSATTAASEPPPEMKFNVKVRNTGVSKDVSGLQTSEAILAMEMVATDKKSGQTGALAITNDMWMAPEIPGYSEMRDFERRYATKLGTVLSGAFNPAMLAMQPGMGQGLADLVKEMSKLKGVPVLQVMRVGSTANGEPLPAASEAPLPATPQGPSAGEVAQQAATDTATSALTSHLGLGGFGSFGKKKKADPPPVDTAAATATSVVLIESSIEMGGFSSASLDSSHFDVPSGYKQVQLKTVSQQ